MSCKEASLGSAGQLVALLSQNVSLPPPGQQHQGPGRPCPYGEPAQLGERSITFAFKAFQLEKKKVIINIKAKASSPLKGRTCREQSRDRNPPGLEHEHFHYEILQKQNEGLGARIALKFKSGCLTLPCTLGNLGGNAG